jgi:hypothetical protein
MAFTNVLEESAATDVRSASRYNLALCQRLLGQTEDARASLERYRGDFPGDARAAEVAYQLGDLHDAAGRPAEAPRVQDLARLGTLVAVRELEFRVGCCLDRLRHGRAAGFLSAAAHDRRQHTAFRARGCAAPMGEARRARTPTDIAQNSKTRAAAPRGATNSSGRASLSPEPKGHRRCSRTFDWIKALPFWPR